MNRHLQFLALLLYMGLRLPPGHGAQRVPLPLGEGKFGGSLNVGLQSAQSMREGKQYRLVDEKSAAMPLTVEFWCKLQRRLGWNMQENYNIFVANEPKESPHHWEVYTESTTGTLSAYIPSVEPSVIQSPAVVTDGQWRFVAMVWDGKQIALYVDGKEVVKTPVSLKPKEADLPGSSLCVGKTKGAPFFRCDGLIDDLRISRAARLIEEIPHMPLKADAHTIGLWNFDLPDRNGQFPDASPTANPLLLDAPTPYPGIDRESWKAGPSPLDSSAEPITLKEGAADVPPMADVFLLDGAWELVEGGATESRLASGAWGGVISAPVPGSVHTTLVQSGVIPDPYFGCNQRIAREWSFKTYFYRKTFSRPPRGQDQTLHFDGICNRATIWLNGKELGRHEGMFDPAEFAVGDLLQDTNRLIVKLDPAIEWQKTVVFNNSYGWHYSMFPPLGIWRSVSIHGEPPVKLLAPFVATRDARAGVVDLATIVQGPEQGCAGTIVATIAPDNFQGKSRHFRYEVSAAAARKEIHLRFTIPEPKLWWPVDLGEPNLYKLKIAFLPKDGARPDVHETTFGVRTVEMAPVAGQPDPRLYHWTFVVNGKPIFVKGAGWCTADAMMDFSRARYERFLTLAALQHCQMLRAWGSGMVETDDFYDLCDRKGLMVMQEWPTAWNSHETQPFEILERTVRYNTLRLRNHPSLVIFGGGNESNQPFGRAIDMMGRLSIELDGTREFHRSEPWGGSMHNYDVYWGGQPIDTVFSMQAIFYGEFGIASYPCYESAQRFLPQDEKTLWPPPASGSFAFHTPVFNTSTDMDRLTRLSRYFTDGVTMERFIVGTQLAQAVGVRHALERARSCWPQSTGALYYKLNDNCPAASWSTVDWYGAPKIAYYLIQDSFSPLVAVALFPKATLSNEALKAPIFLLDDADRLKNSAWEVKVRAFNADLKLIKQAVFTGRDSIRHNAHVGEFSLSKEETVSVPLLIVTDVMQNGVPAKRNYYFMNFESTKDCLFHLPKTALSMTVEKDKVIVKNKGDLPAVGVNIARPGHLDTFIPELNYFWLDPSESKTVTVNATEGLTLSAFNIAHEP